MRDALSDKDKEMKPLRSIGYLLPYRRPVILGIQAGLAALAYFCAFLIRFEFRLPAGQWEEFLTTLPLLLSIRLVVFAGFRLYEGLWRYASIRDLIRILKAVTLSSLLFSAGILMFFRQGFPTSVLVLDWLVCIAMIGGVRFGLRVLRESSQRDRLDDTKRILIVGAGDAGEMLIRQIERSTSHDYEVVGLVDDDPLKQGRRIHDVEVLGTIDGLPGLCRSWRVAEVLIAVPTATGEQIRRIIQACRSAKVQFKTLPSVEELIENGVALSKIRRVQVGDLLRREPIRIDRVEVESFIQRKRVLVTGAGGSIGSEICRQLASFEPETLVLLDRAENNLFFVEMELREKYPKLTLLPLVGDVTDEGRIATIFLEQRPQIVFHAAAHKHVPLMELNKTEAVKNNVLGTMTVANAAWRAGVEDFVMISTDKAVRPSSVMGATKRLAEMYVQSLNAKIETRFMTVRFGNVLGSEGSVLQIFEKQIEAGGPVTITHPDMQRYFMTIPEASQLVLQAATLGEGGEIFVLDMGEPVRIVDLAKDLITLSGLEPDRDIEIKFTGPRPGEKFFEELLNAETRVMQTAHEKVMVVETDPVDYEGLQAGIAKLVRHANKGDEFALLAALKTLVPDYVNGNSPVAVSRGKRERILLIEHDGYTRMTLKRILEGQYQVDEAENRRQAILRITECQPDLVILDLHLPNTNIRRLCARLKGEVGKLANWQARAFGKRENGMAAENGSNGNGQAAIILLLETAEVASLNDVVALGADDRLYKPIPVNILESRVKVLLMRRESGPVEE